MTICRCNEIRILRDVPADDYSGHLVREGVGSEGNTVYRCPQTGRRWRVQFVEDEHSGLSMELRQAMSAVELVEWLVDADVEETLAWTHSDIEFNVPGDTTVHRGIDAARRIASNQTATGDRPTGRALSVVPVSSDEVVVLGDMVFSRDGSAVEHRPCAWLVGVRDGRLGRSRWFASWEEARRVAGISSQHEHRLIRAGRWLFAALWQRSPRSAVTS